jgi:hypothetical protein
MRTRLPSGSLSAYTRTLKGKTYPLISGERDPQNPDHWNWQFTFKQRTADGKLRSRSFSVPRSRSVSFGESQVDSIRQMVQEARALAKPLVTRIADILAFLGKSL